MIQDFPSFIEAAKERFSKLYNDRTFWIHYDGPGQELHYKIPTVENFSYSLLLLLTHHKDDVEEAFERLSKLLSYYVEGYGFPETLHDLPNVKSHHDQLIILKILKLIQEKYLKFAPLHFSKKFLIVLEDLEKTARLFEGVSVRKKMAAFSHEAISFEQFHSHDVGEYLLFSDVDENSLKWYHLHTQAILNPNEPHTVYESQGWFNCYQLLSQFCLKTLIVKKVPSHLLRYLPLLQAKFWDHNFKLSDHSMPLIKTDQQLTLIFKNDLTLTIESDHPMTFCQEIGRIKITIDYPSEKLDEKESFCETKIFFSKSKSWHPKINGKKQTTFSLDHPVTIEDDKSHPVIRMQMNAENGVFLGTLAFGNRSRQKKKTYEAFDQMIGIRTVTRNSYAKIIIDLDYDSAWEPNKEGLSSAIPIA